MIKYYEFKFFSGKIYTLFILISVHAPISAHPSQMSRPMEKPTICICENKDADQRLCFRYSDSTIPLLLKSEISSSFLCLYRSVCVRPVRIPQCWFSHEVAQMCISAHCSSSILVFYTNFTYTVFVLISTHAPISAHPGHLRKSFA